MHHKKKRKLFVHYNSIPIHKTLYSNIEKYLVSYSIPLACMGVLFLGGIIMINPNLSMINKTNAITIQDEWVVTDSSDSNEPNNDSPDKEFGGFVDDNSENISASGDNFGIDDENDGISTQSITGAAASSIALTLGSGVGGTITASTVQGGSTAYASNNVTVTGTNVEDYALAIKAESANLTMPSGANSSTSTVSGIGNGTTGNNFTTNKWGYVLADTSTAESSYGGLTYKTVPTTSANMTSGTASSSKTVNLNKKLVFAAKFADNAAPGTYSAKITLTATATPVAITMANITDMQDMTPEICAASSVGQTATLTDRRSGYSSGTITGSNGNTHGLNQYVIIKQNDTHCWMQENLRLPGGVTLTTADSDVDNSWTLPTSSDTSWSTANMALQMRNGTSGMTINSESVGDGKGWRPLYGNYYSWNVATAGTKSSKSSICPKGWRLPTGSRTGEYGKLLGSSGGLSFTSVQASPYKFSAAGAITSSNGLRSPGAYGGYWTSTLYNSTQGLMLGFYSGTVMPGNNFYDTFNGCSIRCIAYY